MTDRGRVAAVGREAILLVRRVDAFGFEAGFGVSILVVEETEIFSSLKCSMLNNEMTRTTRACHKGVPRRASTDGAFADRS